MAQIIWANQANTTLAAAISPVSTSLTLINGNPFPAPTTGQYFLLTLTSATNSAFEEIVSCTSRSGNTLTIVRAQEGTTAQGFNAGDIAAQLITAGGLTALAQLNGLSTQVFSVANAVTSVQALPLGQAQATFAAINGSTSEGFSAANAVGAQQVIPLSQGDNRYLPIDNPSAQGNLTVAGSITSTTGNVSVSAGGVFANGAISSNTGNITAGKNLLSVLGAFNSGNLNAATILNDFFHVGSGQSVYYRGPDGLTIQTGVGIQVTGVDFVAFGAQGTGAAAFKSAPFFAVAIEDNPSGWYPSPTTGFLNPTICGVPNPSATGMNVYVAKWVQTSGEWLPGTGIGYRWLAIGY